MAISETYKGKMFYTDLFQLIYYDQILFFAICAHRIRGTYYVYEVEAQVVEDKKDGYIYYRPLYDRAKGRWLIKMPEECLICSEEENTEMIIKGFKDVVGMGIKLEHTEDMKHHWFEVDINKDTKLYKNVCERMLDKFPRPKKVQVELVYSGNEMNFTKYKTLGGCAWTFRKIKQIAPAQPEIIQSGRA